MKKTIAGFTLIICCLSAYAQEKLNVLTYNIRYDNPQDGINTWELRKARVLKILTEEKPDIIGLQEVLNNQLMYLDSFLREYAHVGVGRDDGWKAGEYAPVFYKKNRFKKIKWGTIWLSPQPEEPGSKGWDAGIPRIATWVVLYDRKSEQLILVINTHFDHEGKIARQKSAEIICKKISKTDLKNVVFMGDLNATPESEPVQYIVNYPFRLDDSGAPENTPTCCGFEARHAKRIDYIFHSPALQRISNKAIEGDGGKYYASDHKPVKATLQIPAKK